MIGYLAGKFLALDEGAAIVDVGGVGYSVLVSAQLARGLVAGSPLELHIHTNLRENALELFGFPTAWEKRVFHALVSVSGVGPKTALGIMGGLDPETILAAILREDRATLTSVSGVGKKTAELLIVQLGEKARKLLAERPVRPGAPATAQPAAEAPAGKKNKNMKTDAFIPQQGASASPVEIADLWNDAVIALSGLGYSEGEAISAIRIASAKLTESGASTSLEKLIMNSLQLLSRGV